jgi:protein xylosyltransferase
LGIEHRALVLIFPITNYQLPITNYQLPITNYQLPITNYQLPITNYQLPITSLRDIISIQANMISHFFVDFRNHCRVANNTFSFSCNSKASGADLFCQRLGIGYYGSLESVDCNP